MKPLAAICLLFCTTICYGQVKENIFYCGYNQDSKATLHLSNLASEESFLNNENVDNLVEKIVNLVGLRKNFIVISYPNIENAYAVTDYNGVRYIVYDKKFVSKINNVTSDWSTLSILAHEIGHHLSGHTIIRSQNLIGQRLKEIEADEFSGYIMYKLGASIHQAEGALKAFANDNDDSFSTHPSLSKRLAAVEKGYENAKSQDNYFKLDTTKGVEEYANEGLRLIFASKWIDAINVLDKAIKLNPNYYKAYHDRGYAKAQMNDRFGAIADYTEALRINPNFAMSYNNRGSQKDALQDYNGAISDYNEALRIVPKFLFALNNRGFAKQNLGDYKEALKDYDKAIDIDPRYVQALINRGSCYWLLGKFKNTISDCTRAIEINPNVPQAYFNRGSAYGRLGKTDKACSDIRISCNFGLEQGCKAYNTFCR